MFDPRLQGLRCDLAAGRAALWEDVAQRVGVLLSAPAAFAGEHFVQVSAGIVGDLMFAAYVMLL